MEVVVYQHRGKVIFFCKGNKNDSTHVGIVTKVEGNKVYTVEGKTTPIQLKKEAMIQATVEFLDTLLLTTLLLVQQIKLYRGLYLKRSNSLLNLNQDKIMDKDFSSGDGYNAMGYYQFDNRYDLQTFLSYCYGKDNAKYAMFCSSFEYE